MIFKKSYLLLLTLVGISCIDENIDVEEININQQNVTGIATENIDVLASHSTSGSSSNNITRWINDYSISQGWKISEPVKKKVKDGEIIDNNLDGRDDYTGLLQLYKEVIVDYIGHPRRLADVNGDGKADIIGFAHHNVRVSISDGEKFGPPKNWINYYSHTFGNWRIYKHEREVADVNGDGMADIIGFGENNVLVSLSNGNGFESPKVWIWNYAYANNGWRIEKHVRKVADVNGDGMADIIGFGEDNVLVSLSNGSGFDAPKVWIRDYTYSSGGWRTDLHSRRVADVNGDGMADIIGFAQDNVRVSLSNGNGFNTPRVWSWNYAYNSGWRKQRHARSIADVNGDGMADIIGFGESNVSVSLSNGNSFENPKLWIYYYTSGSGGWAIDRHPRNVIDVTGNGKADIVGFSEHDVLVTESKF